jgi:hypothetical protein
MDDRRNKRSAAHDTDDLIVLKGSKFLKKKVCDDVTLHTSIEVGFDGTSKTW